ncbi:MAG: esterase [Bacteroidales bacterium]|nr:esterase [Bacteroidales bacterium]
MKKIFVILSSMLILAGSAMAQEWANFSRGGDAVVSPELSETSVTFRLSADYATVVKVQPSWLDEPVAMTKGEKGVWSATIDLPYPEIHTYHFLVDGVKVNDPLNDFIQRDGTSYLNMICVPGERSENYMEASKRGTVSYKWYDSKILGINRRVTVYTPYGYDENPKKKYPVLYLLHGAGGDEEAWSSMGRAAQILDNLIEKGLAEPMIVVMPNGNPTQQAAGYMKIPQARPQGTTQAAPQGARGQGGRNNNYVQSLCEEIVPFIESHYRVIAKPEKRAIAGLSMGGGHTLTAVSNYPSLFDYICAMSPAGTITAEGAAALKKDGYKYFLLACGTSDFIFERTVNNEKTLTEQGLEHEYFLSDGGHVWANWRMYLNRLAPKLFK